MQQEAREVLALMHVRSAHTHACMHASVMNAHGGGEDPEVDRRACMQAGRAMHACKCVRCTMARADTIEGTPHHASRSTPLHHTVAITRQRSAISSQKHSPNSNNTQSHASMHRPRHPRTLTPRAPSLACPCTPPPACSSTWRLRLSGCRGTRC